MSSLIRKRPNFGAVITDIYTEQLASREIEEVSSADSLSFALFSNNKLLTGSFAKLEKVMKLLQR